MARRVTRLKALFCWVIYGNVKKAHRGKYNKIEIYITNIIYFVTGIRSPIIEKLTIL